MQTNKSAKFVFALITSLAVGILAEGTIADGITVPQADTAQVLKYRLALAKDGRTYQVIMKPDLTPKPDISLSGQVTIKVPHNSAFKVSDVNSLVSGANWVEASRIDAPAEDTRHDYISFSFVGLQGNGARNYMWKNGEEQTIFTFQNEGGCINDVSLMENDDPFNALPNSANTNPGNQFTNMGWGNVSENNYRANYGEGITCPK